MTNPTKLNTIPKKLLALCGLIFLFILAVTALRVPFRATAPQADALPRYRPKARCIGSETLAGWVSALSLLVGRRCCCLRRRDGQERARTPF